MITSLVNNSVLFRRRSFLAGLLIGFFSLTVIGAGAQEPQTLSPRYILPQEEEGLGFTRLVFSPNGEFLAAKHHPENAFDDVGDVYVWRIRTGERLYRLQGDSNVFKLTFSPDSRTLLASGEDGTATLWDLDSGQSLFTLRGHRDRVWVSIFSPDGSMILTGSDDKSAILWDAQTGEYLRTLSGHADGIWSMAFSPDGSMIVTGSRDHNARVWSTQTGRRLYTLKGHEQVVMQVAFSSDGRLILTGSCDESARLWDAETGETLRIFNDHRISCVTGAVFSANETSLLLISPLKNPSLWDIDSGAFVRTLYVDPNENFAVFSPGRTLLIAQDTDATLFIQSIETGETLYILEKDSKTHTGVFSYDNRWVATTDSRRSVRIWELPPRP